MHGMSQLRISWICIWLVVRNHVHEGRKRDSPLDSHESST